MAETLVAFQRYQELHSLLHGTLYALGTTSNLSRDYRNCFVEKMRRSIVVVEPQEVGAHPRRVGR